MAYTQEQRKQKQMLHEGSFSLENKLMNYLRDNYSIDTVDPNNETLIKQLEQVARNYDASSGQPEDLNKDYTFIIQQVISKYLNNWQNKAAGTDDRGHRLGKVSYYADDSFNNIKNTLQDLLW